MPLIVCVTGMTFKVSAGLLMSVSRLFEPLAVPETGGEIGSDMELRA